MSDNVKQQLVDLQKEIAYYKSIVSEITVPIIETLLDNTLLLPLNGHLFFDRLHKMSLKVYEYLKSKPSIKIILIDFTGITPTHLQFIDAVELTQSLQNFNRTLKTLGIRTIYTGFHPEVVLALIRSGFSEHLETYSSYKIATHKLSNEINKQSLALDEHA